MYKRKEYPIKSYVPMRTNKDRTCICCGDTIPAGSSRMIPRHAKANHGLCSPCFRKWRDTGGDLKLMDNPGDAKEEHEEEMRFCKDLNDLRCEMLIDMDKKIEEYLLQDI